MDEETNGAEELTFSQLYERLIIEEDIILDDLSTSDYATLRKGLSAYKTKNNARLKRADLPTEERRIEFETLEQYKHGFIKIRIFFNKQVTITAKPITSDGELK